ncbi:hypothetical protein GSI_02273 [Ganoderma sinense ZZ0214-1]|uniref:Methyltransferase domain-containing protein n=1 Tax=Ganoderma sinense ZZ0214-1 TaxID=1077348 RepID=A0A2G8SP57_9APHY|nr:hypothetical protein GSI_02273 [Ganoderma sinense ZZ0214-1]
MRPGSVAGGEDSTRSGRGTREGRALAKQPQAEPGPWSSDIDGNPISARPTRLGPLRRLPAPFVPPVLLRSARRSRTPPDDPTMTVAQNRLSAATGVTRDVHDELVRQRAEKRRQAGAGSPVQFHKDLLVGDDWTTAFLGRISQGVTIHQYGDDDHPKAVLDLGCGSGLWAIEAAKQWPGATVVGFDKRKIQPDLKQITLGIQYRDLAKRVQWVHGDFLDPLPFESNHFDLVRICCVGLEVPEDSWQELLEECSRVLCRGGTLEMIEEDLLFPAGRTRKRDIKPPRRKSTVSSVAFPRPSHERMRSDSMASKLTTLTTDTTHTMHTTLSTLSSASSSDPVFTTEHTSNSTSLDTSASSSSLRLNSGTNEFLQDHARLKDAWKEMLDRRFLAHKLLTVVPFYLSSTFSNAHVHPTMRILLPPSSCIRDPIIAERDIDLDGDNLVQWLDTMRSSAVHINGDTKGANSSAVPGRPSAATVATWNTLHLGRQVRLVTACKEAIWDAYRSIDVKSGRKDELDPDEPPRDDLREQFERDWENWEDDMKDRMGVRDRLQDCLDWRDSDNLSLRPASYGSGRSRSRSRKSYDAAKAESDPNHTSICRAMRGFVARKV